MKIKELREAIQEIPDNYEIRSRSKNAYLENNDSDWQLSFSNEITKVKPIFKKDCNVNSWS